SGPGFAGRVTIRGACIISPGWGAQLRPMQLQEIVRQADQAPLRADLGQTPERKAPEATPGFDVRKDVLDDRLAAPIDRLAMRRTQLRAHLLTCRAATIPRRQARARRVSLTNSSVRRSSSKA